jgi:hippurate hydrolase
MPHDCIDPIPIACEIVTALQTHVARRVPVTDPAVLTITKFNAGTAHNIVPGQVELLGTMRTLSERTREDLRAAFVRIVEGIAAAHGATAVATIEPGYPVTVNDPRATDLMRTVAIELGGEAAWQGDAADDGRGGLLLRVAEAAGRDGVHRGGGAGQRPSHQPAAA